MNKGFSKRKIYLAEQFSRRNKILASDAKAGANLMDILNVIQDLRNKIRGIEFDIEFVKTKVKFLKQ